MACFPSIWLVRRTLSGGVVAVAAAMTCRPRHGENKGCPPPPLLLQSGSGLPRSAGVAPNGPEPAPPRTSQRRVRPRRSSPHSSHPDNGCSIRRTRRTEAVSSYLSRGCYLVCMILPLRALCVPFASRGRATDPGESPSLDFAVSGAGNRLQGLLVTSLAAADTGAQPESGGPRSSEGDGRDRGARDRASAAEEWAGFVVKDGPPGQVRLIMSHSCPKV